MKKILHFWRDDYGEDFDSSDPIAVRESDDLESCAESYAEFYHNERDGWESSWPLTFTVSDNEGKILGKVSVERESVPVFSGRLVKESK